MDEEPTLDCQSCGYPMKELSPAQAQEVADNPYNFIVFCAQCREVTSRG